jgi:hypothetical protein
MQLSRNSGRVIRLRKRNQSCSLVNQLIERMLSVRPRFAPIDRSGRIVYLTPIERHMFAVAFHREPQLNDDCLIEECLRKRMKSDQIRIRLSSGFVSASFRAMHPDGFEPPTYSSVDCRSIQLSYGCFLLRTLSIWHNPVLARPKSEVRSNNGSD